MLYVLFTIVFSFSLNGKSNSLTASRIVNALQIGKKLQSWTCLIIAMNGRVVAFAGSVLAPFRPGACLPLTRPAQRPLPYVRRPPQHARISMQRTRKSGKGKKVAPIVFATDMKGKPVWKLRSARNDDIGAAKTLIGKLPESLVQAFIEDSEGCSLVCEGTIKGTKEGEGFVSRVFGVALVDVANRVKDTSIGFESGFVKYGELIVVKVDPAMPDAEAVKQKLVLGAMKKLKAAECSTVSINIAKDASAFTNELKSVGFALNSSNAEFGTVELVANLAVLNPDPQRKIE